MAISARPFIGWRMVALGFLAQNTAVGMIFAIYGTVVTALQHNLHTTRALAGSGAAVMVLAIALLSPVAGSWVNRFSIRKMMIAGAVMLCIGYTALAFVTNIYVLLAVFGLILGPGAVILGVVPTAALVSRWFSSGRGKALGLANMSFFILIMPIAAAWLQTHFGPAGVFLSAAAVCALLVPLLYFVIDRPEDRGLLPWGSGLGNDSVIEAAQQTITAGELGRSSSFWLLSVGIGVLASGGAMYLTHLVAMMASKNISMSAAAVMISAFGAAGMIGAMTFGWLADRLGPPVALIINALMLVASWTMLLGPGSYAIWFFVAIITGICTGSSVALHGAALNWLFGPTNVGKAMGIGYLIKLPFIFGAPPLAGHIYDLTGSYDDAILVHVVGFGVAATAFALLLFGERSRARLASHHI